DTIAVVGSTDLDTQADYEANIREDETLRFLIMRNPYRSLQNLAQDNLNDTEQAIDRRYHSLANLHPAAGVDTVEWSRAQAAHFKAHMDDDFNTAGAISVLFELANQINRKKDAQSSALLKNLGALLGVLQHDPQVYLRSASRYRGSDRQSATAALSDADIEAQIAARTQAKNDRNFEKADAIRDHLRAQGIELEDKAGGETQWRRM